MIIRRAAEADLDSILLLAQNIFESEQGIPRVLTYIPPEKQPLWWCAEQDGRIVATVVAYAENGIWHMGRLTVAEELRGQQTATRLLQFALQDLFTEAVEEVQMEARLAAVHILLKFGAEITGPAVPFYKGTITPLRLTKSNFLSSAAG